MHTGEGFRWIEFDREDITKLKDVWWQGWVVNAVDETLRIRKDLSTWIKCSLRGRMGSCIEEWLFTPRKTFIAKAARKDRAQQRFSRLDEIADVKLDAWWGYANLQLYSTLTQKKGDIGCCSTEYIMFHWHTQESQQQRLQLIQCHVTARTLHLFNLGKV